MRGLEDNQFQHVPESPRMESITDTTNPSWHTFVIPFEWSSKCMMQTDLVVFEPKRILCRPHESITREQSNGKTDVGQRRSRNCEPREVENANRHFTFAMLYSSRVGMSWAKISLDPVKARNIVHKDFISEGIPSRGRVWGSITGWILSQRTGVWRDASVGHWDSHKRAAQLHPYIAIWPLRTQPDGQKTGWDTWGFSQGVTKATTNQYAAWWRCGVECFALRSGEW